jgi:hypothetical protein
MTLGKKSQICVVCKRRGDSIKAKNLQWYDIEKNEIICTKHISLEKYRENKKQNQNTTTSLSNFY